MTTLLVTLPGLFLVITLRVAVIFVALRVFFAATYGRILKPLFRCLLRVALFFGLTSLWLFCILYTIAEYTFSDFYFPIGYVWKPAFPLSWRLLFLSLFEVPALAFIQLVWLPSHHLILVYLWWRRKPGSSTRPSQGYVMLSRSESNSPRGGTFSHTANAEDYDFVDTEADTGSLRHCSPFHPLSFPWSLRFAFWLAILCISLWLTLHYEDPGDVRYFPLIKDASANPRREGYANGEKIFIAAMFSNNERVIPYWSNSLIQAIHYLGEDNVFVSVLEGGSQDQSPALLRQLDDKLDAMHVSRHILTEDTTIVKPDNMTGNNRIHFLSALRNRVLEPLFEKGGYDKVVFSNDIFIEPETIVELIKTADGEYDMACGLDFGQFGLYDTWVLRDKQGRLPSTIWPYFFDQEDYEAMQTESPVPVFTCWNGIVIFRADPMLPIHLRSNTTLSRDPLPLKVPITHPAANNPSLRGPSPALTPPAGFRVSAPGECYSSECFLLPYDFRRIFNLQRILVNPRVIVAYDGRMYAYFKWCMRHPMLKWWIQKIYDGAWMQKDVLVVGSPKHIWQWDGGDCHPWF